MRKEMGSVLILLLLTLMVANKNAMACSQITTWAESDASFFGITPEDLTIVNEPKKSVVSDRLVTFFSMMTGPWIMSGQATMRLNVSIYSYIDAAEAAADFPKMKTSVPSWYIIDDEAGFFTYYRKIVYEDFQLVAIHQSCIVSIRGWGNTNDLGADYLRSQFIAIFEKTKTLINSKCGLAKNSPSISFYPYEPMGYLLEMSILKDKGFLMEIQDEDGVAKIDWNTFKVEINNLVDITLHFLKTVVDQGLLFRASQINNGKTLQVMIKVDPEKLMSEHNLFAVAENGSFSVTLKICDMDGLCGSNEYQIYFGPFAVVSKIEVVRQASEKDATIVLKNMFAGNTGKQCESSVYLGVLNEIGGQIWTYHLEESPGLGEDPVWVLFQSPNDLIPFYQTKFNAGFYSASEGPSLGAYVRDWSQFGDGRLTFILGILDKGTGGWAFEITPMQSP